MGADIHIIVGRVNRLQKVKRIGHGLKGLGTSNSWIGVSAIAGSLLSLDLTVKGNGMEIKNPGLFLVRFVFHDETQDRKMKGIYAGINDLGGACATVFENAAIHNARGKAEVLMHHVNLAERGSVLDNRYFLTQESETLRVVSEEGQFKVVEYRPSEIVTPSVNKHIGSSFDDMLREDGTLAETVAVAVKRVLVLQIVEIMKKEGITKTDLAECMKTSRAQVDRILTEDDPGITLKTLASLADAVGKRIVFNLE